MVQFAINALYEANKPFRYQGRDLKPGDPFDVRMNPRRAAILLEQRMIRPKGTKATKAGIGRIGFEEVAEDDEREENEGNLTGLGEPDEGRDGEDNANLEEDTPEEGEEASGLRVVAKGGGWFDVVRDDGSVVNEKALRKDAAEELAREGA